MTMITRLICVGATGLMLAITTPAMAQGKNGGGGGKPPKDQDPPTVSVAQLTLVDSFLMLGLEGLFSDGQLRTSIDSDFDTFGDLAVPPPFPAEVIYQDRRISLAQSGAAPDPCSGFSIVTSRSNAGRVWADLDRGEGRASDPPDSSSFRDCTIFEDLTLPPIVPTETQRFLNDARTITVVFDKTESGGQCACTAFSFLADVNGAPEIMITGFPANTMFVQDLSTCSLTLAKGRIETDSLVPPRTSNPRIIAYPFKELKGKNAGPATETTFSILFVVDKAPDGVSNHWAIHSQEEDIAIAVDDPNTRTIRSTPNQQLFNLQHVNVDTGGDDPTCSGFTMPFQIKYKRFEVEGMPNLVEN